MRFKNWLAEYDDKGFNYYKNMVLGKLSLDQHHGLNQSLDAWNPQQLVSMMQSLGEFKQLPLEIQDRVISKIQNGTGTIGELIQIMANPQPRLGNTDNEDIGL